jgi:hypothetical protein
MLFSIMVPCSFLDNCREEGEGQEHHEKESEHEKGCTGCTPFSVCATCGFIDNSTTIQIQVPETYCTKSYTEHLPGSLSSFSSILLRPPCTV